MFSDFATTKDLAAKVQTEKWVPAAPKFVYINSN